MPSHEEREQQRHQQREQQWREYLTRTGWYGDGLPMPSRRVALVVFVVALILFDVLQWLRS